MMLLPTILQLLCTVTLLQQGHGWVSPLNPSRMVQTSLASSITETNNNVVLRPSEDEGAFDSFRIGSARVHRYKRESDSEADAEYIMWYHGRPADFDEAKELPPLSTGRIGRATSRNGLVWEKSLVGSESEDAPDVSLGLNKESWWGFDTAHVGLGQVLLPMSTPAVMAEGGVYLMYYFGGSFEEKPIEDYLDKVPDAAKGAAIKGMNMKIGVAVSQNGKDWGRVEGDSHCGSVMVPFDESDPSAKNMISIDNDDDSVSIEEELYCGWPDVVLSTGDTVKVEGKMQQGFLMYYSTMRKSDRQKCIGLAVSADGFRWFKRGIILEPETDGLDAGGCARCNVVKNAVFNSESNSWEETDGWTMYYEGVSKEDNKHRILVAESSDGITWKKTGTALDVGSSEDSWDRGGVGSPHVLRLDDGCLRLYYTGQGADGSTAIGVAKFDPAVGSWAREQAEFSFVL